MLHVSHACYRILIIGGLALLGVGTAFGGGPSPGAETFPAIRMITDMDLGSDPGRDALGALVTENPVALGSLSLGAPGAGALLNAVQMPPGTLWYVREPSEAWGTHETVEFLVRAIASVEAGFPGSPKIVIGDISRPAGGPVDRHITHQSGRDADVGWYFLDGARTHLEVGYRSNLDLDRTWALVRALVTDTDVECLMIDRRIQKLIYRHALAQGEDREWLRGVFQVAGGGSEALIRHVPGHRSHVHVRFFNRQAQEIGRLAHPYLVEAGLVPGKGAVRHRVRSGETLSHLARRYRTSVTAIRAANSLDGSLIRAGRTYTIPSGLGIRPPSDPVEVPPRRLPPGSG